MTKVLSLAFALVLAGTLGATSVQAGGMGRQYGSNRSQGMFGHHFGGMHNQFGHFGQMHKQFGHMNVQHGGFGRHVQNTNSGGGYGMTQTMRIGGY